MCSFGVRDGTHMCDLVWSKTEKRIARKAFDRALHREFQALIGKVKELARGIERPSQLWRLESFLTKRRKEIDRQYDFRYSVLPAVLGDLIREGRLDEQALEGLGEDKLTYTRRWANR